MKNKVGRYLVLGLMLIIWPATGLFAQTDAHYWTHQFGAKGLLLNGAVIASTDDETAVFYNPGAMTSEDDFNLSLSFLTPSYSVLKTENYLGDGKTVTDRNLGFAPGLGSFGFNPFGVDEIRMAITSFTRFKSNIRFRGRVVNPVAGDESSLFIGNLEFERKLNERWFGMGLCFKLTDFLSVGASQFITFHSESSSSTIYKELVDINNPTVLKLGWRNRLKYSFSARGGMLTKGGLLLRIGDVKIGATLTTPTYSYFLNSASYEHDELKNFGADSVELISNLNGAKLRDYKTPLSIGFGMDFPFRNSHLSFSIEYFKAIPTYTIIDDTDDPYDGLANAPITDRVLVETGNRGLINFAIGWETLLRDELSLTWGFRTDFNQRRLSDELGSLHFLSTTPNIYHFSVGHTLELWNSKFTFGFDYGFGRKKGDTRLVDFAHINADNLFDLNGDGDVISKFHSLNFILAYDFSFRKKK